jgi:hypothetical protein
MANSVTGGLFVADIGDNIAAFLERVFNNHFIINRFFWAAFLPAVNRDGRKK